MDFVCDNITINEDGHIALAGVDTVLLAEKYKTPLYLMDEDRIRRNCRIYKAAFEKNFREGSRPLFASKACSFAGIYEIMQEEGLGIDLVSCGEMFTAFKAGFDLRAAYFHGNNKTDDDICMALDKNVGCFVADNKEELDAINLMAAERGKVQKILIRLTPGIDPHTYEAVNTGMVDSKFGQAIATGAAEEITGYALGLKNIDLKGFHCHVGSQVFAEDVFERAAAVMLEFIASMKEKYGFEAEELNLGGGYGVRYVEGDPHINIAERIDALAQAIHGQCSELSIAEPKIFMEPGRSIVADAGMTIYSVGTVKNIPGYKTYVSVDGGMSDNPRYALYGSEYSCFCADKAAQAHDMTVTLAGRCCESGDIVQENVQLPSDIKRNDLIAVCTTGAYNYSMASNYNRLPRPAVVMLKDGQDRVVVRRESFEDLTALDVIGSGNA